MGTQGKAEGQCPSEVTWTGLRTMWQDKGWQVWGCPAAGGAEQGRGMSAPGLSNV